MNALNLVYSLAKLRLEHEGTVNAALDKCVEFMRIMSHRDLKTTVVGNIIMIHHTSKAVTVDESYLAIDASTDLILKDFYGLYFRERAAGWN
jgi:hypothetical protein